jgi:hypothetical protein
MHIAHVDKINLLYKESNYIFALQFKALINFKDIVRDRGIKQKQSFAIFQKNKKHEIKNIVRDRAGVARWAHNPKVVGSNPSPATNKTLQQS